MKEQWAAFAQAPYVRSTFQRERDLLGTARFPHVFANTSPCAWTAMDPARRVQVSESSGEWMRPACELRCVGSNLLQRGGMGSSGPSWESPAFREMKSKVSRNGGMATTLIFFWLIIMQLFALVGSALNTAFWGFFLCVLGLFQKETRADPWALCMLFAFSILSMLSSVHSVGYISSTYPPNLIFPIVYLEACCLQKKDWKLFMRLLALLTVFIAVYGIGQFTWRAVYMNSVRRLGSVFGAPNAAATMLMIGWYVLLGCVKENTRGWRFLSYLEPLVLTALGMTLSMGALLALAASLAIMLFCERKDYPGKQMLMRVLRLFARIGLALGTGVLFYIAAGRTGNPQYCLFVLAYLVAMCVLWNKYTQTLRSKPKWTTFIAAAGIAMAVALVIIRPSALQTFTERFEMMQSGLSYIAQDPIWGLGRGRWRMANLADGGKYFNTWHIHNAYIHIATEYGTPAAVVLVIALLRLWSKGSKGAYRGAYTSFLIHSLIETSFFFGGITSFALVCASEPDRPESKRFPKWVSKLIFAACAVVFILIINRAMEI